MRKFIDRFREGSLGRLDSSHFGANGREVRAVVRQLVAEIGHSRNVVRCDMPV
jgi:hypothetical protein